jgi:predicted AAA+ superfamily ATPase
MNCKKCGKKAMVLCDDHCELCWEIAKREYKALKSVIDRKEKEWDELSKQEEK